MPADTQRVRVEEIDWSTLLPLSRLSAAFRMAIHPNKLLTALMLVALLWLTGHALDLFSGAWAYQNEIAHFAGFSRGEYDRWLTVMHDKDAESIGVFAAAAQFKLDAFRRLMLAVSRLDFGTDAHSAVGAMRDIIVTLPAWALYSHKIFFLFYELIALALLALFGGAIARMAALDATTGQRITVAQALRFAASRWAWFVLTPLLPLFLAFVLWLVPVVTGFALFNLPILDVLGGLLFFVPLLCGAGVAFLLIMLATGGHLLYPAIAVEGTDAFDAISRAFGYVLGRPWQWLTYNLAALVYGLITLLIFGAAIFLTVCITQCATGAWVVREAAPGLSRFDAIMPPPQFGQIGYQAQWSQLGLWAKTSAGLVWLWVHLVFLLLPAYAVSFYISANTYIYLLLRRATDDTPFDEVFIEENAPDEPATSDAPAEVDQTSNDTKSAETAQTDTPSDT